MWWFVAVFVIALGVALAYAPKPQGQKAASLGDLQTPTAEEGREIPVLFGTRVLKAPNVVWYGDLLTEPVRKKGGKK